ncbi:MAG: anaerobic C4-dicarboxylate transporter family protein [Candidatus Korobacteraceae bacterium]
MIWVELCILLACILIGARLGGIALGTVSGIGLLILVFGFREPPGGPPQIVIGMIIAVITALATMQAAGGLDYLVGIAEKVMRKHPRYITFVAPVVTYLLILAAGTNHVIYALLPVIAEVSRKANVRPERPMSISVIAGFLGVIASPISAATVAMVGLLAARDVSLPKLLAVTIPSSLIGVLIGALSVAWRGKNLSEDPEYQRRLATGELKPPQPVPVLKGGELFNASGSTILFLVAIIAIVVIGIFPWLRPAYETVQNGIIDSDQVSMGMVIMIIMFAAAGVMMIVFKASPEAALKGSIMRGGIVAVISIAGVSWLGSSFFEGNRVAIVSGLSDLIRHYPWMFATGLFILSNLLFSAAATVVIFMPLGLALDLQTSHLVAFYLAANSVFFLPTYGTVLAAVSFDQTGTTRIGKYLLNHSFMRPGLVATISSVVIGLVLAKAVF